jgi:hypothetical protein
MTYDIEDLLSDIGEVLTENLNTKISELETIKNDGLVLKRIEPNAIFVQEMLKESNYNPFILYGITDVQTRSVLSSTVGIYTINVALALSDSKNDKDILKRMLRYSRALKETIEENFLLKNNAVQLEVQSLIPVEFQSQSTNYRVVGINITATLA